MNDIDIWLLMTHNKGNIENESFGLIAEGRRILKDFGQNGQLIAIALGIELKAELEKLGEFGVNRVIHIEDNTLSRYHGELFSQILSELFKKHRPAMIFMPQGNLSEDLSPRLAAMLETNLITHAVDLKVSSEETLLARRPIANGYLYEEIEIKLERSPIICFSPSVLNSPEQVKTGKIELVIEKTSVNDNDLKTQITEVTDASHELLDLEDAEIVVAGGRGVGKDKAFELIYNLAESLGASVGGTRPIIDWQILPYDRQIGQTGKTISPQLLINCGISGANEYTSGIERAKQVIAVNKDPKARIFRFADLGVVGDLHEILPLLIERLNKMK